MKNMYLTTFSIIATQILRQIW